MNVLRVTIEDLATGEQQTVDVADHDYFIITTGDCHVAHTQAYPGKGTHILTIKDQKAVKA